MPPVRVLLFIYSKYNIPVTHYPPNTAFYRGHTALTSPQGVGKRYRVSARTLCATRNPQGGGGCGVWADPLPLYLVCPPPGPGGVHNTTSDATVLIAAF